MNASTLQEEEKNKNIENSEPLTKKIEQINSKDKHIYIKARVEKLFELIQGKNFKMRKIIVSDNTGTIAVVIWNEKCISLTENLSEGDIISVINGYARENPLSKKVEVHVGKFSDILLVKKSKEKTISEMEEGLNLVDGYITFVFSGEHTIKKCAICKKKVNDSCEIHGNKAIEKHLIIKLIINDGLNSIKVAAFDGIAEKLLSLRKGNSIDESIFNLNKDIIEIEAQLIKNKDKYRLKNFSLLDEKSANYYLEEIKHDLEKAA
ncbi:MAG: OB-fold nucleic acid binding domain-containing protein [Candidatus Parvarchaeota archaeon]|nr:OB-fold nucleic acid binding domain-containing protein [Candidatus Rehaiarchaeum fermentans]